MQHAHVSGTHNIHFVTTTAPHGHHGNFEHFAVVHCIRMLQSTLCEPSQSVCYGKSIHNAPTAFAFVSCICLLWLNTDFTILWRKTCWRNVCGLCRNMHKASQSIVVRNCQWFAKWFVTRCCLWSTFIAILIGYWQQQWCIIWRLRWHSNAHARSKDGPDDTDCVCPTKADAISASQFLLTGQHVDHFVVKNTGRPECAQICVRIYPEMGLQCSRWRILILSEWRKITHH